MALTPVARRDFPPVSRLDPACRLICLALLSAASILASWPAAALLAFGFAVLLRLGGLRLSRLAAESTFVAFFALAAGGLRLWTIGAAGGAALGPSIDFTLGYGAKLLASFLAARLFYASTGTSEMRDAVTRIARRVPLARRVDAGLILALVIEYMPLIFEEWKDSLFAARARGLPRRPSLIQAATFLGAFLRRLILRVVAVPAALSARGWTRDRGLMPSTWKTADTLVSIAAGGVFVAALLRIV